MFICLDTNKPGSGFSSPRAAGSEQLSQLCYWQRWCGAISSRPHHRGKDHCRRLLNIALFLPVGPLAAPTVFQGIPSDLMGLRHGFVCVSVGAGFRCRESSLGTDRGLFSNAAGAAVDGE